MYSLQLKNTQSQKVIFRFWLFCLFDCFYLFRFCFVLFLLTSLSEKLEGAIVNNHLPLSVRPSVNKLSTFSIFSVTTAGISTKLDRKQLSKVFSKVCSFRTDSRGYHRRNCSSPESLHGLKNQIHQSDLSFRLVNLVEIRRTFNEKPCILPQYFDHLFN